MHVILGPALGRTSIEGLPRDGAPTGRQAGVATRPTQERDTHGPDRPGRARRSQEPGWVSARMRGADAMSQRFRLTDLVCLS